MNEEVKEAWVGLERAISRDSEYATELHENIVGTIMMNSGANPPDANRVAAHLMKNIFNYDVTGLRTYTSIMGEDHSTFSRNRVVSV